jgi:hypothetical protein
MPKTVEVSIIGISPYSQSRKHDTPKKEKEGPDAHERRTWRERCNVAADGEQIVLPAMALKQALDVMAARLGDKVEGKSRATYSKYFLSGVLCEEDMVLEGCTKSNCIMLGINAHANGKRGSGTRVRRFFPQWDSWRGIARFAVLDDTITRAVFERHLKEAGRFVGVGRFRPENGGLNGRFTCEKFKWEDI